MTRVTLEQAYVLHRRPYSNTSLIVDFFTKQYGRVSAVARNARGPKSRYRGKLELFYPMLINWSGKGELKTLGNVEFSAEPLDLQGHNLLCGFYLHELLMRLLHREDPHPQLFLYYQHCIAGLVHEKEVERQLRFFEKNLLEELGYGLSFEYELQTGVAVSKDKYYKYIPDRGFMQCEYNEAELGIFSGESLLALHNNTLDNKVVLQETKRLMRLAFSYHLGAKPLKSRDLLR